MKPVKNKELVLLKVILWTYIILCLVIAGLNFGYVPKADPDVAKLINSFWHLYENEIKTIFIILGSWLTWRIISKSQRTTLRKANLLGLIISAMVVHIVGPWILSNKELYFFTMPLPWSTTPLQLLYPSSSFYLSRVPVWGVRGVSVALFFYLFVCVVVLVGTLLFGRRWQCSTLCLFNGFASEVFAPVTPLLGKRKPVKATSLKVFMVIKWLFFGMALFFTCWWILFLAKVPLIGTPSLLSKIEVYKYLSTELLMAMFFWVAFTGRGYCYYCPLGTTLALLSKISKQHIATQVTHCIQCNRCNFACPMSIDIKYKAILGQAVTDLRCVGCGHCVDVCPTKTLLYSTTFLARSQHELPKISH
jgi:ferredoxin-type protein NapH